MLKSMKPGRKYFIINIDELYGEEIYEVLKKGQLAKNEWPEGDISFEEWKRETFIPDVVDVIIRKNYDRGNQLIKLYSVVMLNYRQPLGDKAWSEIGKLFGDDSLVTAFSFLMGFASGTGAMDIEKFKKFIESELKDVATF